jgi:hypothetical protein
MSELNTMMNISKKEKKALESAEKKEKKEQEVLAKKTQKEQAAAAVKQEKQSQKDQTKITNKGTGAGGGNTNKNGLAYEELTDLTDKLTKNITIKKGINEVEFEGYERKWIKASKDNLKKYMKEKGELNDEPLPAPGCKEPDEAYVDPEQKIVFIIEKKFQQGPGSVDEKIQTGPFKLEHYKELFPNYKVYYMYCLSDWFKRDEYNSSVLYNNKNGVQTFWGGSETYKQDIIEFIHNSL